VKNITGARAIQFRVICFECVQYNLYSFTVGAIQLTKCY